MIRDVHPVIQISDPDLDFLPIPDPRSRVKATEFHCFYFLDRKFKDPDPDPGSEIEIRKTCLTILQYTSMTAGLVATYNSVLKSQR